MFCGFCKRFIRVYRKWKDNRDLELCISKDEEYCSWDIFLCNSNGDIEYDEEDFSEYLSEKLECEINNVFFDGNEYGGVLYFTEKKIE